MAIKTIEYKISVSGITPSVEQFAGIQGDHCATKISISIDDELYGLIMRNFGNSNLLYRFDVYDGEGGIWQSEPKELAKNVQIVLEERHTRHGGKITVYLVITVLSEENQTEMELYSFPCILRLKNRPDGEYQDAKNHESIVGLVEIAKATVADAALYCASAQEAELATREFASEVEQKLANGEFDGKDGVSITHSFDGTVLKMTSANGTTTVDLKGEKGEQGPKGDKGESGKDAVTDKSYSPQSENAQSGKAVAEAVSGCVQKVNGDGLHYRVYAATDNPYEQKVEMLTVDTYENADGQIPRRHIGGNLKTNTPFADLDCANKKYVDDAVSNLSGLKLVVVSTLPNIGDADTLYFVPSTLTLDQNLYDEYIYTNGSWEKIGSASVEVDLTDYVKNTDYATSDTAGIVKVLRSNGLAVDSEGRIMTDSAGRAEIAAKQNYKNPIMPSNLDYAVKVGITTNTETLTDEEKAQAQSWLGIEKGSGGDNWELINKITTTEDVKRIMCTTDSNGNEFLLKKVVFIVRSQPSANADGSVSMYYLVSTYKTRNSTSTVHQIGELTAGLRKTAQQNCVYVEQECYIPSGRADGYGLVHFHIVGGDGSTTKPKYQMRDIVSTRDEQYITCAYVESSSDTTIFGAGSELEIWGVRA